MFAASFLILCGGGAPDASAATITVGPDGKTEPVFDLDEATRERVFIPQPGIDQDGDGDNDRIAVEIIRPKESGTSMPVPAVIDPSPYYTTTCRGMEGECIADVDGDGLNDRWPLFVENYFLPRGYAYVLAEANGTANSDGCSLHSGPGDIAGMKSVIDWLNGRVAGYDKDGNAVSAGWHNGSSAMIGKSYDGTLANGVAATGVEGLKTIVPITAISDWYFYSRMGGIRFNTNYPSTLANLVTNVDRRTTCLPSRNTMNDEDGDEHGDRNVFWDARNFLPGVGNVRASVFAIQGLQDDNVTMNHLGYWWDELKANDVPRKLWLLRGGHVDPFDSRRAVYVDTLHRWFDHWLLGIDNGIMDEPAVDIEDSRDTWNTYADWPVPGTSETDVYLRGTATAADAGALGLSSGGDADSVSFTSTTASETTYMNSPTGSQANRRVFLSPPLEQDLRISGTPRVDIQASLSTTQSNLGALIVDYGSGTQVTRANAGVQHDTSVPKTCWGQSSTRTDSSGAVIDHDACYWEVTKPTVNVTQWRVARGVLDSSNRESLDAAAASPVIPGEMTSFRWPLQPDDYVFKAGHQIGVVVVGNYSGLGVASPTGVGITLDARVSKLTLPIVGGYPAARASGAFAPDTVAPAQTVPRNILRLSDDASGEVVTYPAPGVSDDEDPAPTATCDPPSGHRFPIGTTTVTCTARDASGNETVGTFKVTIVLQGAPGQPSTETPPQNGPIPPPPPPVDRDPEPTEEPPTPPRSVGEEPPPRPPTLDVTDIVAPQLAGLTLRGGRRSVRLSFRLAEPAKVTATVTRRGSRKVLRRAYLKLMPGRRAVVLRSGKLGRGRYVVRVRVVDEAGNVWRGRRSVSVPR